MAFHKVSEKVVRPQDICFTQESICVTFKRPRELERIDDAVDFIIQGRLSPKAFPNMNVVQFRDRLWSLDNRRLWVFKKAEVSVVTVTIVTYDNYHGLHNLMSMSYSLSKRDFFPRIRGVCKEVFAEEDPEEPSSPPLPSTPRGRVHMVYSKSNHLDYEDPHHHRRHLPPPAKTSRVSNFAAQAWTPYGDCSSPPTAQKLGGYASHHRRRFTIPVAAHNAPIPLTPEQRHKAPRPPEKEIRAAPSFAKRVNLPSSSMKPRKERNIYPESGDLPSYRTTEPKVLHSREKRQDGRHHSQLPTREKGPAVPPVSKEKRSDRDREATSASRAVENPKSTFAALKRSKPPNPTSSPPNISYDFHSSRKRSRACTSKDSQKVSKKANASCPSTKSESSTRLNDAEPPPVPSAAPSKTQHGKSKSMSTAPLPSLSTTAGPSTTTKRKERGEQFTAADLPVPSVPAPKSPPATSKKLQDVNSGASPPINARQESPAVVECEAMTQTENNLFKLDNQAPVAQDLHLRVTPGKELTPQDRQTLDAIVELFLRGEDAKGLSHLHPGQVKSRIEPETEQKKISVIPTDEVCAKPQQEEEPQDASVRVNVTRPSVVECPVKYDSKGQLFERTLEVLGPLSNPSTTCFGDGNRQRVTGNVVNVTVTADLKPPAARAQSTPVSGRQLKETQPETKANATNHQHAASTAQGTKSSTKRCREKAWIGRDDVTARLTKPTQEVSIPGNVAQINVSKRITRGQIKQQKEIERRKARQKRKEKEREAKAKAKRDSEAESLPEKEREAKAKKESEARFLQEKEREAKAKKEIEAQALEEKEREAKAKKEIEAKTVQEEEREEKAKREIELQVLQERESREALAKSKESEAHSVQEKQRRKAKPKAKKGKKEKSQAKSSPKAKAKKKMTTDIVPYDPKRSKAPSGVGIAQNGELVYVKVDAEFTGGCGTLGLKKNGRSKLRLHPYLRIIGPFTVLGRYNPYAVRLELPDDCNLKPTFSLKALLKSRSPLDNYLPEKRIPVTLEPEVVLKKRMARRLKRRKVLHYLVKWKTLPYSEATWESETIFDEYPHLLDYVDDCPVFPNPFLQRNWRA